jgi:hypothetical protein
MRVWTQASPRPLSPRRLRPTGCACPVESFTARPQRRWTCRAEGPKPDGSGLPLGALSDARGVPQGVGLVTLSPAASVGTGRSSWSFRRIDTLPAHQLGRLREQTLTCAARASTSSTSASEARSARSSGAMRSSGHHGGALRCPLQVPETASWSQERGGTDRVSLGTEGTADGRPPRTRL